MSAGALDAVEEALGRTDPDDVLRGVIAALVREGGCDWAGFLFVEEGELVLGPHAGEPRPDRRTRVPVVYRGDHVAELVADGEPDRSLLDRVALLVAAHCLVGWDTGGVPWDSVS